MIFDVIFMVSDQNLMIVLISVFKFENSKSGNTKFEILGILETSGIVFWVSEESEIWKSKIPIHQVLISKSKNSSKITPKPKNSHQNPSNFNSKP